MLLSSLSFLLLNIIIVIIFIILEGRNWNTEKNDGL